MQAVRLGVFLDEPHQKLDVVLDNKSYTIALDWNARTSSWSMGLLDSAGRALFTGKGLRINIDLTDLQSYNPDVPPGALMLVDSQDLREEATTISTLGRRHFLYYVPESALP